MFPTGDPNLNNENMHSSDSAMLDSDLPLDPLFGLMDMSSIAFPNMSEPFFADLSYDH